MRGARFVDEALALRRERRGLARFVCLGDSSHAGVGRPPVE